MQRTKGRRSPGVMLQGRLPVTAGRWDDEVAGDGGKAKVHRAVRHAEDRAWRAEAAGEVAEAREDGLLV